MCPSALQGCKANQAHTDTHPTKSEWDSSNAKLAKRSYGKGVGDFRGIVRVWKGWCGARVGEAIPPVVARIFSATAPHL